MNRIINDPFTSKFPHLDIHGETSATCIVPIKSFIKDNIKLKNKTIVIVHGKGYGILRKTTQEYLKRCKDVERYYLDGMNDGQTIVELHIK